MVSPELPSTRYPYVSMSPCAQVWLQMQADLCAPNTASAYGRALDDYLRFTAEQGVPLESAPRDHIAAYVRSLTSRPARRVNGAASTPALPGSPTPGLANATIQQRLTVIRLFYDYLMEEGTRPNNPVGRGRYTPGNHFGEGSGRGLLPRYRTLPWIPNDDQWHALLSAAQAAPLRTRVMLAFAYDAGLRRKELCALAISDIDPATRLLHLRAETTKNGRSRVVPYSEASGELYAAYLTHRQTLSRSRGNLFVSESRRNRGAPITIWTWSKVIQQLARQAGVPQFTTHTLRHLCLTDLARAGWDLHEIAAFAGHRSLASTLLYIHLSGRELAAKVARSVHSMHAWRMGLVKEAFK